MEKLSPFLSDNMEGFIQESVDFSQYETSFRRLLVSEIDLGRMSVREARDRFKTPTFIIDDKMFNGNLFEMIDQALRYLVSHIKVAFEISGETTQRTEIFEYPLPALREMLLNSLIHRDYRSPIDTQIKIFDEQVSFFNPGQLMGNLTLQDLKNDNYRAYARNKLIAEAFYLTGDIEKYGSGFLRIRKEISSYPTMSLLIEEIPNGLHVQLSYTQQKVSTKIREGNNKGNNEGKRITQNQKTILNAIQENPEITIPELSEIVGINISNIQKNIRKLRELEILERIGSARAGYWSIKGKI